MFFDICREIISGEPHLPVTYTVTYSESLKWLIFPVLYRPVRLHESASGRFENKITNNCSMSFVLQSLEILETNQTVSSLWWYNLKQNTIGDKWKRKRKQVIDHD